jgi:pancreatic triacylglycerol lipase
MKNINKFLIFVSFFTITLSSPISHYTWETVEDSEGRVHLVDVNQYDVEAIEPLFVPEDDIIFNLCTARNPTACQEVKWNDMNTIINSPFDSSRPTKFTVHGWNGGGSDGVNWRVNQRFFTLGDYNVRI